MDRNRKELDKLALPAFNEDKYLEKEEKGGSSSICNI
jgi:hypothetical protein